jgi:hypothetical protein
LNNFRLKNAKCVAFCKTWATTNQVGEQVHSNGDAGTDGEVKNFWGNNHGSIAKINGDYFIFGRHQTNGHEFSRQGVAEKLTQDELGGFMRAEMTS